MLELQWTGQGENQDGTILYSSHETRHEAGVTKILSQAAKKALLEYEPISDRAIIARFSGCSFNITVIQVYAPTMEADDAVLDQFYNQL